MAAQTTRATTSTSTSLLYMYPKRFISGRGRPTIPLTRSPPCRLRRMSHPSTSRQLERRLSLKQTQGTGRWRVGVPSIMTRTWANIPLWPLRLHLSQRQNTVASTQSTGMLHLCKNRRKDRDRDSSRSKTTATTMPTLSIPKSDAGSRLLSAMTRSLTTKPNCIQCTTYGLVDLVIKLYRSPNASCHPRVLFSAAKRSFHWHAAVLHLLAVVSGELKSAINQHPNGQMDTQSLESKRQLQDTTVEAAPEPALVRVSVNHASQPTGATLNRWIQRTPTRD